MQTVDILPMFQDSSGNTCVGSVRLICELVLSAQPNELVDGVVGNHMEGDADQSDAEGEAHCPPHDHLYSTIWKGMVQLYLALFRY